MAKVVKVRVSSSARKVGNSIRVSTSTQVGNKTKTQTKTIRVK